MNFPLLIHAQNRDFVYPLERNRLVLRVKTARKALESLTLISYDGRTIYSPSRMPEKQVYTRLEMKCYARDNLYDYYETEVMTPFVSEFITYFFEARTGETVFWMNSLGYCTSIPQDRFFTYKYTNVNDVFRTPEWSKEAVYYQIFPDRFCNGEPENDPEDAAKWGARPTRINFMGGDLKGIIQKIDYISELGVNALYLTPIFKSPSNHKYDTTDYLEIDPHLGTEDDFKELVSVCHRREIKVVIDGVFNHCGVSFAPFADLLKNGAASPYKDWFLAESLPLSFDPLNYESFGNGPGMPKINYACPQARDYILGVVRYWIREADIDGWRLDVADEIDRSFLQEIRKTVKQLKPDCIIIGETWIENTDMLRGEQTDSVMNYLFRNAALSFFTQENCSSSQLDCEINRYIGIYPRQAWPVLYNLIGSHDTDRFLTLLKEDIRKFKAVIAFQFCSIGSPAIYYGDEVGLTGGNDPDCRKCMPWDQSAYNHELLDWYKRLIAIRKSHKALSEGDFCSIYCSGKDHVYGFCRSYENERLYIAVNNSDQQVCVSLPIFDNAAVFHDLLTGRKDESQSLTRQKYFNDDIHPYQSEIALALGPYQACILERA